MNIKYIISFIFCICCAPQVMGNSWPTTTEATITLAKQYNDLLNQNKIAEAMAMVSENVIFSDPTWGVFNVDKKGLTDAYSVGFENYYNLQFKIRNVMSSKNTVVIHMIGSANIAPNKKSKPEQRILGVIDMIRVIHIENGKVTRHTDIADYDAVLPQLTAAQNALKQ